VRLRFKFVATTVLLFLAVLAAVGSSVGLQQREALTHEVLARGVIIAENLAAASQDFLRDNDTLTGMALAKGAVEQKAEDRSLRDGHRLSSVADWGRGLL
jgi:hypothetical protein